VKSYARYQAWSDGSRVGGGTDPVGAGGWACVVEHRSDGWVLRGSAEKVTSTRMELVGALEALRSIPRGEGVDLHVDCTVLLSARDAWVTARTHGSWRPRRHGGADADLWRALFVEFDQLDVGVIWLGKRHGDQVHRRCHLIANAEARALHRGDLPQPLPPAPSTNSATGWHAFDVVYPLP
jgi:ribonuclease HI